LTGTADGLLKILQAVNSDWVAALLDFGNYHSQDPYIEFTQTAPYAIMSHAKPIIARPDAEPEVLDYRKIAEIMKKADYRGFLSIEHEVPGEDARVAVPTLIEYLREATAV